MPQVVLEKQDPVAKAQALLAPALERMELRLGEIVNSTVSLVPEISRHLIGAGGKRMRPILVMLMARATGADTEDEIELALATELLHSATLLHDDVIDCGHLRRGVPAAPRVFGNSASILVGDFLMAHAFGIVVRHGNLSLLQELSRVFVAMSEGELMQLVRSSRVTLSLPGYEEIISGKTAGLFSWCCRAGATLGAGSGDLVEAAAGFGKAFGMAFQVTDDILDYTAPPEESGKDLANDLLQGKVTLPLLLASDEDRSLPDVVEQVSKREPSQDECREIVSRVLNTSAVQRSLEKARAYVRRAYQLLEHFPDGLAAESLGDLAGYIVNRVTIP